MSELPRGWTSVALSDLAGRIDYGFTTSASQAQKGPRFLRITDLTESGVDWETVPFCTSQPSEKFLLKAGDIVIARTGATTGKSYLLPSTPQRAVFASYLIRVQLGPAADPRFVAAFMRSPDYWRQITIVSKGTAQPGANASVLGALDVPLAPLNEQRRIVAKLDDVLARSRRAKVALDAVPALMEKLRQSILASAFRGDLTADWRAKHPEVEPAEKLLARIRIERRRKWEGAELGKMNGKGREPTDDKWKAKYKEPEPVDATGLPELPEGWAWASLEELSALITSGSRGWAEYYADSGPLFIRSQDINADALRLHEVAHVKVPASAEGARTRVQRFDLLITITGANVTRCAWVGEEPGEAYVSQHVALVRPVTSATTPTLHLWLVAEAGGRRQLKTAAYGLGKPGLNLDDVATVHVPVPPAAEQAELIRRATSLMTVATRVSTGVEQMSHELGQLERSALAKAFRGELVPQVPNDEPAEVMLARLRDGGASKPEPTKRRRQSAAGAR